MTNEIKVGDKVRVREDAPKMYLRGQDYFFIEDDCKVDMVEDGNAVITNGPRIIAIPTKYLVKVAAEAKEAKFKVGDVVRIKPIADKLHQGYQNGYAWLPERDKYLGCVASVKEIWCDGSIILSIMDNLMWEPIDLEPYVEPTEQTEAEKPNHTIKIPVEVDLTDSYWNAYTADLAKEVALKVANKFNAPHEAAEYAVSVAKAVVEGLKKKRKMPLPDYCYRAWQELNTPLNPEEKERIERKWETELKKKQNKTNMKLKDLIFNREKLRKYDELKEWKEYFDENRIIIDARGRKYYRPCSKETINGVEVVIDRLPDNIKQIIISALDTEIKKLDEE